MKVLWIVNILFPEAAKLLGLKDDFKRSGGWLLGAAEAIISSDEVSLSIVSTCEEVKSLTVLSGEKITYYIIPNCKRLKRYGLFMQLINQTVHPDIVHIHGTEFPYGKAWLDVCPSDNVVVSIQGLISVIARYYSAGLSWWEIARDITFRDLMRRSIFGEQREFRRRGLYEVEVLKRINHIIGRTSFDRAHCESINPDMHYYFCNETLRTEFYDGRRWDYIHCQPYTIFLSQATYPVKALHQVLKALPIVMRTFPDTQIRVAGGDITRCITMRDRLSRSGYGKIIRRVIKNLHLEDHITFTGPLTVEQMKEEYLNANVFICPSSIENSSNSLGEAQLMGVPVLASYVGGVPSMIPNPQCGLMYRFEDVEVLAHEICTLFENSKVFDNTEMIALARQRHDSMANSSSLTFIYKQIKEKNK